MNKGISFQPIAGYVYSHDVGVHGQVIEDCLAAAAPGV
jgi:hypothetical protein